MDSEAIVKLITRQILERIGQKDLFEARPCAEQQQADDGLFDEVDAAVDAAFAAQEELMLLGLEKRAKIIEAIRRAGEANAEMFAGMTVQETGMGRAEDKITRILAAALKTPGLEDLRPEDVFTGAHGVTMVEKQPFGVVCCITPSTNPTETIINNAISMIAAGNSVVVSPHPGAKRVTIKAITILNKTICEAGGPKNLIVSFEEPTLQKTNELLKHPKISLLVATGGPKVVKAVLSSGKKAIGAGAGNPPALVDETADIPKAARDIVMGASFDNDLNCIGEKEVIVVEEAADQLIEEMIKNGAYLLRDRSAVDKLTKLVTTEEGDINKDYIGKDAQVLLQGIGILAPGNIKVIIYEARPDHITVMEEFLMPILPIVRVKNVLEGIELAVRIEGGRHHTGVIHSKNIDNMTRFAQAIKTTIFVKNGSSFNGVGIGGEGYFTATIAGPTGEGLTSARNFSRLQRCVLVGGFNLRA